jgi:hypothetical protein
MKYLTLSNASSLESYYPRTTMNTVNHIIKSIVDAEKNISKIDPTTKAILIIN